MFLRVRLLCNCPLRPLYDVSVSWHMPARTTLERGAVLGHVRRLGKCPAGLGLSANYDATGRTQRTARCLRDVPAKRTLLPRGRRDRQNCLNGSAQNYRPVGAWTRSAGVASLCLPLFHYT